MTIKPIQEVFGTPSRKTTPLPALATVLGILSVSAVSAQDVIAGWDTWNSISAPASSTTAAGITATASASATGGNWSNSDGSGRGSSDDTTWGSFDGNGDPASAVTDVGIANFTLTNAKTDGQITFTIVNNGTADIALDSMHFDAYAFRPKAARTYALNVLAGSDITVGNVITSAEDAIPSVGNANSHGSHTDYDLDLTGLADSTLEVGGTAIIQLAFSDGQGDGSGGHHLFLDNVALSGSAIISDKLVVLDPVPASATAGVDFSVTVQAQDPSGTPINVTQDTPIALVASGIGTLTGNTATILSGQSSVTLSNLQYTAAEAITLSGGSTGGDALSNGGPSTAFTVDPGAAAQVAFSTQPSASTPATIPFATQPVVEIQDSFGNVIPSGPDSTVNVSLSLTTGTGTLSGTSSMAALDGVADFAGMDLSIDLEGTDKVLTAEATIGAGTVTATTDPFTIIEPQLTWLGSPATHNWTTAAELNWSGGTGVYVEPSTVIFDESGSDASPIDLVGTISPVSITVDSDSKNYVFGTTGSGSLSGTGKITKTGDSTLTLETANDHSGGIDVFGGTLNVNNASALGTGVLNLDIDPALGNTSGGPIVNVNNNPIEWKTEDTAPLLYFGPDDLDLGTGDVNMRFNSRGVQVDAGNLTFGGEIKQSGSALRSITKTGAGSLTFAGPTSYLGNTIVNEGTLINGSGTTFTGGGGALQVGVTGTFDLNGFDAVFSKINPGSLTGTITNSGSFATLTSNGQTDAINNLITGDLALNVANANEADPIVNLANANTFTGGITLLDGQSSGSRMRINSGTPIVTVGSPGAIVSGPFGTGPITIGEVPTDKAGIMMSAAAHTLVNDVIFNTALGSDVPGIRIEFITGGMTLAGELTAELADVTFSAGKLTSGALAELTGKVTGDFGLALTPPSTTEASSLTVTLNNAAADNDYLGDTTIGALPGSDFTLALGAADQIPNGAGTGNVISDGTLDLNTFSETINGLSGAGIVDSIAGGTPVLTVGDNDASSTFDGNIVNTAGTLALTKVGTGAFTLNGNNSYGGATSVNIGCLVVTNPLATPADGVGTTVAADAGFGFDPAGFSDAELTTVINNVTWDPASDLVFSVNSPDSIAVPADLSGFGGSTIVLKGDGTLDLSGATVPAGVTFETPDGGVITPPAGGGDITIDSILTEPGTTSGKKVTLSFTAPGNVDIYASDDLTTWQEVATDVAASPFIEDDVAAPKRFYVVVTAGETFPPVLE